MVDDDTPVQGNEDPAWLQIDGTASINNTPPTWITVNAGVAVITGSIKGAHRAAIEDGVYVSNPIERAATLAGVTFHLPYDSTRPSPSARERVGVMLGAVLTPAAGIYIGPTAGWRGFSLTVGLGTVWVETTPDDKKVGDAVVTTGDQLVRKAAKTLMIGGTYVFGG